MTPAGLWTAGEENSGWKPGGRMTPPDEEQEPMSKPVRARIVETYTNRYRDQKVLVLIDYRGLTSAQASSLRLALRADKIRMTVLKNSSARRAFEIGRAHV